LWSGGRGWAGLSRAKEAPGFELRDLTEAATTVAARAPSGEPKTTSGTVGVTIIIFMNGESADTVRDMTHSLFAVSTKRPETLHIFRQQRRTAMPETTDTDPQRQDGDWKIWASAVVIVAAAVTLRLMGQPLWCKCGGWSLCSWNIWSSHNSQHLIDPYTPSHVLHGVLFCGLLFWLPRSVPGWARFLAAIVLEAGWEILENSPFIIERYRTTTIAKDYIGDSVANSVSDILACAAGYAIAFRLRTFRSLMFAAATELILLVCIRDCLTLNVLMLVYPMEAIRQWQTAGR